MTNIRVSQSCICKQCGKTFFPFRASKGIYCSNECKFTASQINREFTCAGCGKNFTVKKHQPKYCSNPCYQQFKSNRSAEERLYSQIVKTDYCWLWTGNINHNGYGRVHFKGKSEFVHRLMYELATGEDISDKVVRHFICDNPPCCNPAHLRSGTMADNSQDMVNHKRHAHGETSYAKITEQQVIAIRADSRTHQEIAADFGLNRRTVGHIKSRSTWKHLP